MLVQRSVCPDLGHTSVDQLLVRLAKDWLRRGVLDQRIDATLTEVCNRGVSLRAIFNQTGIPKSTAHDRVQRRRAGKSEVAA